MELRLNNRPSSPRSQLEQEKKLRREIANSNERRRMQSINAGFNSLRTMLPKHDGEKLSKAAILQHTAEYIYQLEQDKTKLLQEISQLKRIVLQEYETNNNSNNTNNEETQVVSAKKVKIETIVPMETNNSDSSDEGIQVYSSKDLPIETSDASRDELRNELIEVRKILDRERRLRMQLEDQVRSLEAQIYPEKIKEIANQVQLQFQRIDGENVQQINVDETTAAVSSVVSDEIAETIEIETDCPDSPMQSTIVIQATPCSPTTIGTGNSVTIETPQDLTSKTLKQNAKSSSKSPQPAAIALPIDVPFIGTDAGNGDGQTVTVQIIGLPADATSSSNAPRHNLDTIVQAIRHLEGDHLFRDEEEKANGKIKALAVTTAAATAVNNNSNNLSISNESEEKAIKTVTLTPALGATLRQQVIHTLPIQSRPGVIVANRA